MSAQQRVARTGSRLSTLFSQLAGTERHLFTEHTQDDIQGDDRRSWSTPHLEVLDLSRTRGGILNGAENNGANSANSS
jgi:hypothetical protein